MWCGPTGYRELLQCLEIGSVRADNERLDARVREMSRDDVGQGGGGFFAAVGIPVGYQNGDHASIRGS